MSHPARGRVGTTGIDGEAIAASRRRRGDRSRESPMRVAA